MAVKKVVNLEVKSKGANKVDKDFKAINKTLKDVSKNAEKALTGDNLKKVTNELKNTATAAKSTKNRLRELEDEMADIGDVNSPQFQKLAKEAGVLKDKINNAKSAVKAMSADFPKLQVGVQGLNALGAAGGVAMGASQLLGSENENLTKGIQKMMAVQMILNGVNTIANALSDETALGLKVRSVLSKMKNAQDKKNTTVILLQGAAQRFVNVGAKAGAIAMKILGLATKGAMLPITLIVAAIGLAIAAFSYFSGAEDDSKERAEAFTAALEKQNAELENNARWADKAAKKVTDAADMRRRKLELNGASDKELHEDNLKRLEEEELARQLLLRTTQANMLKQQASMKEAQKNAMWEENKAIHDSYKANEDLVGDLIGLKDEYWTSVKETNKEFNEGEWAKTEASRSAGQSAHDTKLANRKAASRIEKDLEMQISATEIEKNNEKYRRLAEDANANKKLELEERTRILASYEALRLIAEQKIIDDKEAKTKASTDALNAFEKASNETLASEIEAFQEKIYQDGIAKELTELEVLDAKYFNLLEMAKSYKISDVEITAQYQKEKEKINKKSTDKEIADAKKVNEAKVDMVKGGINAMAELATAFAGKSEAGQKRAFQINKVAGIASATIDTITGVQKAYASQIVVGDPTSIIRGQIAGVIAGVSGAARVAAIARTKFGGGTVTPPSTPEMPTPQGGGSQPAQFNVIGNTGINQLSDSLGNAEPMKAYVVSGDVTSQQSLDRNKNETASL